jgi:hypothetical protein
MRTPPPHPPFPLSIRWRGGEGERPNEYAAAECTQLPENLKFISTDRKRGLRHAAAIVSCLFSKV